LHNTVARLFVAPEALFFSSEMRGLLKAGYKAIESGRLAFEIFADLEILEG